MESAVVDRIEGGTAVLLVGDAETEVIIPVDQLPAGAEGGVWLQVQFADNRVVHAEVDAAQTAAAKARVRGKLARLRDRGRRR